MSARAWPWLAAWLPLVSLGCPSLPPECPSAVDIVPLEDDRAGVTGQSIVDRIGGDPLQVQLAYDRDTLEMVGEDPVLSVDVEVIGDEATAEVYEDDTSRGAREGCMPGTDNVTVPVEVTLWSEDGSFPEQTFTGTALAQAGSEEISVEAERTGIELPAVTLPAAAEAGRTDALVTLQLVIAAGGAPSGELDLVVDSDLYPVGDFREPEAGD